jgi:hypothetical protein
MKRSSSLGSNNATRIFGYDVFISFALGAPARGTHSYASDLARRLRELDFTVFFSEDEASPGDRLDSTLLNALLRSRVLVVIANHGTLEEPRWVRKEVEAFRNRYPERPVVPINVSNALQEADLIQQTREWLPFEDTIWVDETSDALTEGIASDDLVKRLALTPAGRSSNTKWRWLVRLVISSLIVLSLTAVGFAVSANRQRKQAVTNLVEANRQKGIAETNLTEATRQKGIAETNLAEANLQKGIAEKNLTEANRQKGIAEEQTVAAEQQTRFAQAASFTGAARSSVESSPETAALYAIEGLRLAKDNAAQQGVAEQLLRLALSHLTGRTFRGADRFDDGTEQRIRRGVAETAITGDGKLVAAGTGAGQLYVWRVSDGVASSVPVAAFYTSAHEWKKFFSITFDSIDTVGFAYGEHWLLIHASSGEVRAFDVRRNFAEISLPSEWKNAGSLTISPDGKSVAIVSQNRRSVTLWHMGVSDEPMGLPVTLRRFPTTVSGVSYSADGQRLVVRYDMREFSVVSITNAQRQEISLPEPESYLNASDITYSREEPEREVTEISPNGQYLLASKVVSSDYVQPQRLGAIWDISGARPCFCRSLLAGLTLCPALHLARTGAGLRWVVTVGWSCGIWNVVH